MIYSIKDFNVGDLVIINTKGIQDTDSQNIRNIPVRITKILDNTQFELEIQAPDDVTDYSNVFGVSEIEKIITLKENPEYWL